MNNTKNISGMDPASGNGVRIDIDDGLIFAVTEEKNPDAGYLSAGLIDLQVNGYGGLDFNAPDLKVKTVLAICQKLAGLGVTRFLPTIITASENNIIKALKTIARARNVHPLIGQMVAGVHMEGPSISPLDGPRGAHPLSHVRAPSTEEFARWQEAAQGLVKLVTLAPEHVGAQNYIKELANQNVHVSLGHTNASPDQIAMAAAAGASLSTHLGNGAAAMLPRHPNFIWAQLAHPDLSAMFISDGHHLPADTFAAMVRAKGLDNSILVSDSVALAGMPPGIYQQAIGGKVELSPDGRISMAGTPFLAGAAMPLGANIAMAIRMANLTLSGALKMASENPGRFIGGAGRLAVGQRADIIRFDWSKGAQNLDIRQVWLAGRQMI
ncbi:N-acetylglucosamine-6-phosphate deacetylase [hydrothermal vent metagenome]|uniref:N-acetylglucosamine-6-phosphate deacetylase n=1 Tax=hydrothermal vent metagenome TaxID=652676 RepID=A0A3B0U3U1_9ZZZZ